MFRHRTFYKVDTIACILISSIAKQTAVIITLGIRDRVWEHRLDHVPLLNYLLVVSFVLLNYIWLTNLLLSIYFFLVVFDDCLRRFVLVLNYACCFWVVDPEGAHLTMLQPIAWSLCISLGYCIFRRFERTSGTDSSDMTSFLLNTGYKMWIDFKHEHPWIDLV